LSLGEAREGTTISLKLVVSWMSGTQAVKGM
jgi:hypothetical protein